MPASTRNLHIGRLTRTANKAWLNLANVVGLAVGLASVTVALPASAQAEDTGWRVGAYAGKYYDTEPGGFLAGRAGFVDQYLLAVTANKTVWQAQSLPFAVEIDGMVGTQWGQAELQEIAIAPVLRWSGMPGRDVLRTDLRFAPLGISYTSVVSPLERGRGGQGSNTLNWLFIEAAFSSPKNTRDEFFMRLHHRCAIYDLLNDFGANGEDFLAFGFRRRF